MPSEEINIEQIAKLKLLLSIEGIGPGKILNLFSKFSSFDEILHAPLISLMRVENISSILAQRIFAARSNFPNILNSTELEFVRLQKIGGKVLTYWDNEFPELLKKIYSPPILLYYIGNVELLKTDSLAIVGTRIPSAYGKLIAEKISKELALQQITITSGMARGIDSIAHSTTLSNDAKTIAVIGSGLDIIYPPENNKLFNLICQKGLVVSEYPLGSKPDPQNFPKRNRIISGLSLGTIVIETKINGGAMQTARFALDQGREVFSVPGNISSPQSEGTNLLIQKGEAKLIINAEDILMELNLKNYLKSKKQTNKPTVELTLFEQKIFDTLSTQPKHIDVIANDTDLSTSDCLVNLLELEFKGIVRQFPGKMFVID
ncbi:MAG: DNA-processing protein DprA [bacterium]